MTTMDDVPNILEPAWSDEFLATWGPDAEKAWVIAERRYSDVVVLYDARHPKNIGELSVLIDYLASARAWLRKKVPPQG